MDSCAVDISILSSFFVSSPPHTSTTKPGLSLLWLLSFLRSITTVLDILFFSAVTMPWFLLDVFEHSHHLNRVPMEVLLVLALVVQYIYLSNTARCKKCTARHDASDNILLATTHINWYTHMLSKFSSSLVKVNEWKSDQYRIDNGWKGNDYMHSSNSHVRIFDYFMLRSSDLELVSEEVELDFALSAVVYFSACAESHKVIYSQRSTCV